MTERPERRRDARSLMFDDFVPEDEAAALTLERNLTQGETIRISFHRSRFARRAERFERHRILVARRGSELIGTCAVGFKHVLLLGEEVRAALIFDLRVHPAQRRGGTALRLLNHAGQLALGEAELVYSWVIEENRASHGLGRFIGAKQIGAFQLLVYPTHRNLLPTSPARTVPRDTMLRARAQQGPSCEFEPCDGSSDGLLECFLLERDNAIAGCSVWTLEEVLGEVVEGLPVHLAWLGQAQRHWPFSRLPLPHIPAQGERVRSWYVCDIFATSPRLARDLVRHVAQRARSRGINFCNVVAGADDPLLSALRADHLAMFSPLMRYKLMARRSSGGPLPQLTKIRVDALDI